MKSEFDALKMIYEGEFDAWMKLISSECADIVRSKLDEIPGEFYEHRFSLEGDEKSSISLVEFSMKTATMNPERRNGLMEKYRIDPRDFNKLQAIVDSINVAGDYGMIEKSEQNLRYYFGSE